MKFKILGQNPVQVPLMMYHLGKQENCTLSEYLQKENIKIKKKYYMLFELVGLTIQYLHVDFQIYITCKWVIIFRG